MAKTVQYYEATSRASLKTLVDAALAASGAECVGGVAVYVTNDLAFNEGADTDTYTSTVHYCQMVETTV